MYEICMKFIFQVCMFYNMNFQSLVVLVIEYIVNEQEEREMKWKIMSVNYQSFFWKELWFHSGNRAIF